MIYINKINKLKATLLMLAIFTSLSARADIIFTWHSGAMNALIPLHALESAGLSKMNQAGVAHYGTSSGAIAAALLSDGYSLSQVIDFFEQKGASTFGIDKIVSQAMGQCTKACQTLKNELISIFGHRTLKDLPTLHIFAAREKDHQVVELSHDKGFGHIKIADALMASASIPQIFGKQEIDGEKYFDAGIPPISMNDPSALAINSAAKVTSKNTFYSMANGFMTPALKDHPDTDFTLLKAPTPEEFRWAMDLIPLKKSGTRLVAQLAKINPLLGLALALINPPALNAKKIFEGPLALGKTLNLSRANFYSAMTNPLALSAFEKLGGVMADKNSETLQTIATKLALLE